MSTTDEGIPAAIARLYGEKGTYSKNNFMNLKININVILIFEGGERWHIAQLQI